MASVHTIFLFLSLLLFVLIFYWPWQRLCVDWSRQLMFEERDRLFLLTRSSKSLPLDSELHIGLRSVIDGTIRYCHRITWQRLLVDVYFRDFDKEITSARAARLNELMNNTPQDVRQKLRRIIVRMAFACIVCMMGRSLLLGPLFLVLYLLRTLRDSRDDEATQGVFHAVQIGAAREQCELEAVRVSAHPRSAHVRT
jgi:hypothetical protein